MSIESIITVHFATAIHGAEHSSAYIIRAARFVRAAGALGGIVSAPQIGKTSDRVAHSTVIILALESAGLLLVPQAFVTNQWQLIGRRFVMGLALGGLFPCIAAVIRHDVPDELVGTVKGYSLAPQFNGQVAGPLIGARSAWGRCSCEPVFCC
ncbi:MFS transporter [Burkholderia sp. SIMBA_062]|uniref:MFS transporter n=1 Tax=Burkholderia sp. SIMBA_062 TaxID=3085803 RepID=UPI00397B9597